MPWYLLRYMQRNNLLMEKASDGTEGGSGGGTPPADPPADDNDPSGEQPTVEQLQAQLKKEQQEKADLLKDAMKKKGKVKDLSDQLSAYGDVTPERLQELLDAENQRIADADAAEQERLKKAGDFEALTTQMAEQHTNELSAKDAELSESQALNKQLQSQIIELTVGADFSQSKFLAEETVLPANKARRLYGDHFEVQDGKVVGYDKPANAENRVLLVDGQGTPVPFETAISRIIDADSDRDSIIRSKQKAGAKSSSELGGQRSSDNVLSPQDKIAKGLANFSK